MHDGWQYLMLMRHGHSFANAAIKKGSDSHFYSISGSDDRIELDELGKLEASKMSRVLSRLFRTEKPLTKIWTSSYVRVTQTADIIVGTLKYPVERYVDRRLAREATESSGTFHTEASKSCTLKRTRSSSNKGACIIDHRRERTTLTFSPEWMNSSIRKLRHLGLTFFLLPIRSYFWHCNAVSRISRTRMS